MKKKISLIISLLLIANLLVSAKGNQLINKPAGVAVNSVEYQNAIVVSKAELDSLEARFKSSFKSTTTYGGAMSKDSLQAILNSSPTDSLFIPFIYFDSTNSARMQSVAFRSLNTDTSQIKVVFNKGAKSFCPTSCNMYPTETEITGSGSYSTYLELYQNYQKAHPKMTWGGLIDKAALQAIINSLNETQINVSFRFGWDTVYKERTTIFIGGKVGQTGDNALYIRNGGSVKSFCPISCGTE